METIVAERILEDLKTIRQGVVKFEDTELGKKDHLVYQMKLALNRIEFQLGIKQMRKLYDLRESQVRVHELGEKEIFVYDDKCESLVKFYCQVGDTEYFQVEAIVPFTEDDETYFVKLETPAKTLMKHLGEKAEVKVWVGDHSQVVWSPRW